MTNRIKSKYSEINLSQRYSVYHKSQRTVLRMNLNHQCQNPVPNRVSIDENRSYGHYKYDITSRHTDF